MSPDSVGEDELRKQIEAVEAALNSRSDLAEYREHGNHRLLFALELHTKTTDIRGIATDALLDGMEDKSIDLLHVDSKSGVAYLMQGYQSQGKRTVPYDKAKELFHAIGWALGADGPAVPARLVPAVTELHRALAAGAVDAFEIWLVHNLPESGLHDEELSKARAMAEALLRDKWARKDGDPVAVVTRQVGSAMLAEWYKASHTPILVTDRYEVPIVDCYIEQAGSTDPGEAWRCVVTSVDAQWLRQLAWEHSEQLFSANVRSYMGRRSPINKGIQSTISERPDRLLVYHNGVTALVNKFEVEPGSDGAPPRLVIHGISIVNGAQTVGSISRLDAPTKPRSGETAREPKIGGRLPIRFIECPNREILLEIIRYNNTQNPTEPTDFRSNDRTQHRLVDEFRTQFDIPYDGARRGHLEEGKLARPAGTISANTVGRILAAFHGDPEIAYFRHDEIWERNEQYARVFPDRITAAHVLFCYSLYEAIEAARRHCARAVSAGGDRDDGDIHAYFANRGAVWLLLAAIGRSIGTILGPERSHNDRFALTFQRGGGLPEAVAAWGDLLDSFLAFGAQSLSEVFREQQGLRDTVLVGKQIDDFRRTIKGKRGPGRALAPECDKFAELVAP